MPPQRGPVVSNCPEDGAWVKIEQAESKIIRMLGFDFVRIEALLRKVLQILRYDEINSTPDSGCQNMPIPRIRKAEAINQRLKAHYQGVWEMLIHRFPGSFKLIGA
ncbi:MAG: hypothetical protein RLO08_14440 [Parvibaculaceae bacterium]